MSATEDTSRLFRAMGLERKVGEYKDLGPLTRSGRIAAFDESALPMMAAVARSLDAPSPMPVAPMPAALVPAALVPVAPALAATPVPAPVPASISAEGGAQVAAARPERMSPLMASLAPPAPPEPEKPVQKESMIPAAFAPPVPTAAPSAGISALSRVFERYAASPAEAVAVPSAAPVAGTPLKPLFDRLR